MPERPSPIQPLGIDGYYRYRPQPNEGYNSFAQEIREVLRDKFSGKPIPWGAWSGIAFEIGCSPGWVRTVAAHEGYGLYIYGKESA